MGPPQVQMGAGNFVDQQSQQNFSMTAQQQANAYSNQQYSMPQQVEIYFLLWLVYCLNKVCFKRFVAQRVTGPQHGMNQQPTATMMSGAGPVVYRVSTANAARPAQYSMQSGPGAVAMAQQQYGPTSGASPNSFNVAAANQYASAATMATVSGPSPGTVYGQQEQSPNFTHSSSSTSKPIAAG